MKLHRPRRLSLAALLATAMGLLSGGCATTSDTVIYEGYGYGAYYGSYWYDPWYWHPDEPDFIGPPFPPPACDKPPCHRPPRPPCDTPPCHRPPIDRPPPPEAPPGERPPVERPPPGADGERPSQLPTRPVSPSRPMPPPRPSSMRSSRGGGRR